MSESPTERPVPELIDDRTAGMLRAVAEDEVIGHIQYLVLETPEAALAPVHTIVDPGHEGHGIASQAASAQSRAFSVRTLGQGVPFAA
ncbi:hypothetical protein ABZ630_23635, partial [Streptomyces albidoflavus]